MLERPDVLPLLANNDSPPESIIQAARQKLRDAESKLEGLKERIQGLYEEVAVNDQTISQYKQILSPIRMVSDDVLREIFVRTLERERFSVLELTSSGSKQNALPPMLLTQICQRWRDVAVSTPRLWSKIIINLPTILFTGNTSSARTMGNNALPRQFYLIAQEGERMEQWLKRSGALPLSISVRQSSLSLQGIRPQAIELDPTYTEKLTWIFQKIANYLPRCERLAFNFPDAQIYQLFSNQITPDKIMNVRYFKPAVYRLNDTQKQVELIESPLFTSLPALRRLHLPHPMSFLIYQEASSWAFSPEVWKSITHIVVEGAISLAQGVLVMEQCPSLVELELYISEHAWNTLTVTQQEKTRKQLSLDYLEYLNVHFNTSAHSGGLWNVGGGPGIPDQDASELYIVSMPRLQNLQYTVQRVLLEGPDDDSAPSPPDFTSHLPLDHIVRSAERLKEINVSPHKIKEKGFMQALKESGNYLTHLYIQSSTHFPPMAFQEYIDNGYELSSETDAAFHILFPLPEWCKSPAMAGPVPLTDLIDGQVGADEMENSLDNIFCPRLTHLDIPGLQSVRPATVLALIVYRLRLYEYARMKGSKQFFIAPLTTLNVGIMGKSERDVEIAETVEKLAATIGIEFSLKLNYQDPKVHGHGFAYPPRLWS